MHILIIGGTGVLSTAVTAEALKQGIKVTMINRGNRPIPDGVEHIKANKDDLSTIAKRLKGRKFDAVMDYLCLFESDSVKSYEFYSKYAKQYFFISSCAVYDTTQSKICYEDSPKELQLWDYSILKWASEKRLCEMSRGNSTHLTIIRPCVTYDDTRIPYGITPHYGYHWTMIARIMSGKPIITWNAGENRCNMTHVDDFAKGVVGLIGNPLAYGEAFNVCSEETPSFKEVLDVVGGYIHHEIKTVDISSGFYAEELPVRAGEILGGRSIDAINSNDKLKEAVPTFQQTINLKEGIEKTLKAYEAQHYQHGIDWQFDGDCDRIIKKWCKKNGIDTSSMNLGFVDYLGNATKQDKILYWRAAHINKSYYKIRIILGRIKRLIKR